MKGRILALLTGGLYDVLPVFFDEICEGFEQAGYEVQRLKVRGDLDILLHTSCFEGYDFVFSFNSGAFLDLSTWIAPTTVVVAFLVDYPVYHDSAIRWNNCPNYLGVHVDRYRVQFAEKYYPQIDKNAMILHGGTVGNYSNTRFEERLYDIVQFGGYQAPNELMAGICQRRGENKDFSIEVIRQFLTSETISFEAAFRDTAERYGRNLSDEEVFSGIRDFQPEEMFIRAYVRDMAVRVLLDSGQEVHVFGNGWENYEGEHLERLHIHGAVDYRKALDIMGNAKIVLNVAPTLNNGSHERIFDTMLNGAVCFTNRNLYLEETGLAQEVVEYSIVEMDTLPEMTRLILNNPGQAEAITAHAKKTALEHHTWKNRAKEVIQAVEDYRKEKNYCAVGSKDYTKRRYENLILFLENNSKETILNKMKCCLLSHEGDTSGYLQQALDRYNHWGYWGTCNPETGDFTLLENRANELKEHLEDFAWLFEELSDYQSKEVLYLIIRYWLDFSPMHLREMVTGLYNQYFDKDIIQCTENEVFVDCGAYTGDTVISYIGNYGVYKRIYCYEASENNMKICKRTLSSYQDIAFREYAVGGENTTAHLTLMDDSSANRLTVTDAVENSAAVPMVTLDDDIKEPITFIKMDIEGGEMEALLGASNHIRKEHPKLAIAAYHNNHDIWRIARTIKEIDSGYRLYLRYYGASLYPAEYVLYGVWES